MAAFIDAEIKQLLPTINLCQLPGRLDLMLPSCQRSVTDVVISAVYDLVVLTREIYAVIPNPSVILNDLKEYVYLLGVYSRNRDTHSLPLKYLENCLHAALSL